MRLIRLRSASGERYVAAADRAGRARRIKGTAAPFALPLRNSLRTVPAPDPVVHVL